ncbi:uncharacterized protein HKW66_Vig0131970 [Vigna angularis]|uniref:Uncharacterized protein n=1 Tax=Phaseolus angularis TaxID=3914 RepID=A0A8T0K4C2_PHAAN|nr:uncharacterized protein HKW66_Vig0131970 [Vigna angularis]
MAPRLPPPPQPNEPDASNNARLLETVIDRLQQQNTTLMEQNATLMQQNQAAMQSLEASRANSETMQRQLMEILAATREWGLQVSENETLARLELEGTKNRRNVHPAVVFLWNRTELESKLIYVGTVERNLGVRRDGGASLEEMLEEENLDDANLVEVEVKAEP